MKSYLHVYRLGKEDVEGILNGTCYIQPKLDGTNGSVWYDRDTCSIKCASRNRELSESKDNAGFYAWVHSDDPDAVNLRRLCTICSDFIFYGEWLVKTKLGKHYTDKGFYIFDVYDKVTNKYVPYYDWLLWTDAIYKKYVPSVVLENPKEEDVIVLAKDNHFLLPDSVLGEGVVIKNYDYVNEFGNFEVAKIVNEEFLAKKGEKEVAAGEIEQQIIDSYVTEADMKKVVDKMAIQHGMEPKDKGIGMFMSMVWKDLIDEEMYTIVKKFKNPVIDFKTLQHACNVKCRKFLNL